MKIHKAAPLVCTACVLLSFTLGISLGKTHREEITITQTTREISESSRSYTLLVNINTASVKELTVLPGIGNAYAESIVAYRDEHGPFKTVEELLNIGGIGQNRLEAILDYITVGGTP